MQWKLQGECSEITEEGNVTFTVLIEEDLAKQVEFKLDVE